MVFFSGAFVALLVPLIAILTDDLSELGARTGIALFFTGIGALIGTPIGGAILTDRFIWWRLALFSGILTAVGSVMFLTMLIIIRRRKALQKGREKA